MAGPTPLFDTYLIEFATAREEKRKDDPDQSTTELRQHDDD